MAGFSLCLICSSFCFCFFLTADFLILAAPFCAILILAHRKIRELRPQDLLLLSYQLLVALNI
jgi:hypothetical protein